MQKLKLDIKVQTLQWKHPPIPKIVREKPLGSTAPYAWVIELVHGCNLRCGHCSARLLPKGEYQFMSEKTWVETWKIIAALTPTVRVDICLGGEPSLHPKIYSFLKLARTISPKSQIQITTNGTMLRAGKLTYKQLLLAGANIVYTDMYGPTELFVSLAEKSGYPFYKYYEKPVAAPSPWTYHGPELKLVVLQEQPENWPNSRFRAGLLGTWCNNLDWKVAKQFGLKPVITPPNRRCNQPFVYSAVQVLGNYILCCQDNMSESAGQFGNVREGQDGFHRFWYGEKMQVIRNRLRNKDRAATTYCSRCCITFSRCDYLHWEITDLNQFWNGKKWKKLKLPSKLLVPSTADKAAKIKLSKLKYNLFTD